MSTSYSNLENHYQLTNEEFERLFEKGTLPPTLFTHEAHLRLAWVYVNKYGIEQACDKLCDEIKQFDKIHGDGDKFNKTVTVAAARAVYHFMLKSNSDRFSSFMKEFPRLKTAFKDLLNQHYAFDVFSNETAKVSFVEPDILPFD